MPHHVFETAFGYCGIVWHGDGVRHFMLPEPSYERVDMRARRYAANSAHALPSGKIAEIVAAAKRYFAGEREDFQDAALDLAGAASFNRAIYNALLQIPYGATTTYGALAAEAGFPGAARETGAALGANPLPLLIPCHRVLGAGGQLGGFSAPGGKATKQKMLALEHATPPADDPAQTSFTF